jgi:hypothetical protein
MCERRRTGIWAQDADAGWAVRSSAMSMGHDGSASTKSKVTLSLTTQSMATGP